MLRERTASRSTASEMVANRRARWRLPLPCYQIAAVRSQQLLCERIEISGRKCSGLPSTRIRQGFYKSMTTAPHPFLQTLGTRSQHRRNERDGLPGRFRSNGVEFLEEPAMRNVKQLWNRLAVFGTLLLVWFCATPASADDESSVLNKFHTISTVASTVPANGDINPYGIVIVRQTIGNLQKGHVLISNFNSSANLQGTGTSIVDVAPDGTLTQFAQINAATLPGACPGGVGLTTALAVLQTGWVIVGSLPTSDGTSATAQAGCLIVLDSKGNVAETFYGSLINGPWDMTSTDNDHQAKLYVTNVLNGTVAAAGKVVRGGTVTRLSLAITPGSAPALQSITVIGSGFPERTDPAALVIGPTGVALDAKADILY